MKKHLPSSATETESTIKGWATAILILFVLAGVVCFFNAVNFGVIFVGIGISCIFWGVMLWAILRILAEISVTLKHLRFIQDPEAFGGGSAGRRSGFNPTPIENRKLLNKAWLTMSGIEELDGLTKGENIIVKSTGKKGVISYFTTEGHVVVKLEDGNEEAFYVDDVVNSSKELEFKKKCEARRNEIAKRKPLELNRQKTNSWVSKDGLKQGDTVFVFSLNCFGTLSYFTEDCNVIVKTDTGTFALYIDDITKDWI